MTRDRTSRIRFKDDIRLTKRVTTHPGEMLKHEFLLPLNLSASKLAGEIGVPANRLTELVSGRRSMTANTALKLAERFGTTPESWMNLQMLFDLSKAIVSGKRARKVA